MSAVKTSQSQFVRLALFRLVMTLGFAAFACSLAVALVQPANAYALAADDLTAQSTMTAQVVEISGTVNASTLKTDVTELLRLTGDTTLNLDADITCRGIESRGYDLTITGSKSLTIYCTGNYGIEMRDGDLTIAGGTVSITTAQYCIHSHAGTTKGNITISGGSVSLVATNDSVYAGNSTAGATAIFTYRSIHVGNASVYCEGEIYADGNLGSITIDSNAKMTVRTAAQFASGVIYSTIGKMQDGGFEDAGPLEIDAPITKPTGGKVGEVQQIDGFDPDTGVITNYSNYYNRTIVANGKAANEVVINGGAVKPTEKISINGAKVTGLATQTYRGRAIEQVPTVTLGDTVLKANVDFTYKATNNTNVGTATVTVEGIGDYTGTASGTFKITPLAKTPNVKLTATSYVWDGKVKTPSVNVDMGNAYLARSSDYAVAYAAGRKNVGSYTVTVTAREGGNFSFPAQKLKFAINPKGTTAKAPKAASKALTVKWAKQAKKMSAATVMGYQVQVATNKAFTKNKKQVSVKGFKNTSAKVTKLKAKKAYYARVRTYMKVGKATYCSAWSTYKKAVKTQ